MGLYIFMVIAVLLAFGLGRFISDKDKTKLKEVVLQLKEKNEEQRVQLEQLNKNLNDLKKAAKAVSDLQQKIKDGIPDFSSLISLEKRVQLMEIFWNTYYDNVQFIKVHSPKSDVFFRDLYRAVKAIDTIKELQEKVTTPFYGAMDQEALDAVYVREKLLKMAMQMYDVISSFQSPNQRKSEQGLNIGIVKGEKTEEEALKEAKIITDLEVETPRWIRSMAFGVKGIGVDDKGIIFSGYKLNSQKEVSAS